MAKTKSAAICPHCNKMFFSEVAVEDYGVNFNLDLDRHAVIELADGREFSMLTVGFGALFVGGPAIIAGVMTSSLFNVSPAAVILGGCVGAVAGALLTFAVALQKPGDGLLQPDRVQVESLDRVEPNRFRLRTREIDLPTDDTGRPLFDGKQLVSFAEMVMDSKLSISEESAKAKGISRARYTVIRNWAIEKMYLQYKDNDNPRLGVFTTGYGRNFFNSVLNSPTIKNVDN